MVVVAVVTAAVVFFDRVDIFTDSISGDILLLLSLIDDDDDPMLPAMKGFAISTANGISTINERRDIDMAINLSIWCTCCIVSCIALLFSFCVSGME